MKRIISILIVSSIVGCSNIQVKTKTPAGKDGAVIGSMSITSPNGINVSTDRGVESKDGDDSKEID